MSQLASSEWAYVQAFEVLRAASLHGCCTELTWVCVAASLVLGLGFEQ